VTVGARRAVWRPIAAAGLFGVFVAQCLVAERADAPTYDETTHLSQGLLHLIDGDYRFQVDHPPFAKLVAGAGARAVGARLPAERPAWRPDMRNPFEHRAWAWRVLYRTPENDAERLFRGGRLALVPLALVILLVVWRWTRSLHGEAAGLAALALAAFDPNLVAHAHLVTSDAPVTALLAAAAYALWRGLVHWRPGWCLAAGACLGLALATKYTALLVAALVPLLALGRALDRTPWPYGRSDRRFDTPAGRLAAAAAFTLVVGVTAWGTLWATYRFRGAAAPDLTVGLTGHAIQMWLASVTPWPLALVERAAEWRVVPDAWALGLVYLVADAHLFPRVSYLAGALSERGWWYYFPAALALKAPLATLILAALGVAGTLSGAATTAQDRAARRWASILVLGLPLGFLAVAGTSSLDVGLRQVLPLYPFLLILAGGGAAVCLRWRRPLGAALALAAIAWVAVASARIAPDYLAYFNEAAGGPDRGIRWLVDSNLDWGQALRRLPAWLAERGIREVNLCYFGTADPDAYGLRHVALPGCTSYERPVASPKLPGFVAISATHLVGVHHPPELRAWYQELLARGRLVGVVGHAIHVYDVAGP
jgi:4-amino-4-deoxy-L-arabinose transferase-like glycosyltransferase